MPKSFPNEKSLSQVIAIIEEAKRALHDTKSTMAAMQIRNPLDEILKSPAPETVIAIVGGVLGTAGTAALVTHAGVVSGVSASGITSGLAALGGLVGQDRKSTRSELQSRI